MTVLSFPIACRRMIDAKEKLGPSELEAFWLRLKGIAEDAEQARRRGDRPEDAIMGGIAALELLHQEWIEADPEREEWCGEQFLKILENPPARPQFHIAESTFIQIWRNVGPFVLHSRCRSITALFKIL